MGGETVILDLNSGIYYGLDVVGARVWTLIEHVISVQAVCETIVSEYDVDAETCSRDVLAFVNQMRDIGLVEVTNGSRS